MSAADRLRYLAAQAARALQEGNYVTMSRVTREYHELVASSRIT